MGQRLKSLLSLKLLRSTRTAAVLMIILGLITWYGAAWQPSVFAGLWFEIPVGLLFLNTLVCTVGQIKRAHALLRRHAEFGAGESLRGILAEDEEPSSGFKAEGYTSLSLLQAQTVVGNVFRRLKYRDVSIQEQDNQTVVILAKKRKSGYWGAPLFHSALLIIMLGGIFSGYGRTAEHVVLTEGGYSDLKPGVFSTGGSEQLALNQVRLDFDPQGELKEWAAAITLSDGEKQETGELTSQREFTTGGRTIAIKANGYTPGIIVREDTGETLRLRVFLQTIPLSTGVRYTEDLRLGDNQTFHLEFFPDAQNPLNPTLAVQRAGENTPRIMRLGESAQIEKYRLTFDHVKPWLALEVRRDPGYPVLVLGISAAILGLILIFSVHPRRLRLLLGTRNGLVLLRLKGESNRYPALFTAELNELMRKLRLELGLESASVADWEHIKSGRGKHGD